MINNVQSLKAKVRKYSAYTGANHQQIIQNFMFEKFLDRVSHSEYKTNFIIKGGCLLSSIMGIDMRTTMDIDTNITGITFTKETIDNIIDKILAIELNDNATFQKIKIEKIKEGKEYSGFRFSIIGHFFNIKVPFHIDVSTGDKITPSAINYQYKRALEDGFIELMSYNYETVIAEKLQSILDLKLQNSRMKDYYDIYFLMHFKENEINKIVLEEAISNTFTNRNALVDLESIENLVQIFKKDKKLNDLWKNYQATHNYAKEISFEETLNVIERIAQYINRNYG